MPFISSMFKHLEKSSASQGTVWKNKAGNNKLTVVYDRENLQPCV